eukprot:g152.t1
MRIVALKKIPLYDSERRHQMIAELRSLYFNQVSCDSIQRRMCFKCGAHGACPPARRRMPFSIGVTPKQWGATRRSCSACEAMFCGACKKNYMKSAGHHVWLCIDCNSTSKLPYASRLPPGGCSQIVKLHDVFVDHEEARVSIVTELMDSGSLQALIDAKQSFTPSFLAIVSEQILKAMRFLHKKKLCHRDIKPANILFNSYGQVKLTDFGLAVELSDRDTTNAEDEAENVSQAGTQMYFSPLRIHGAPATCASDVWSFGASILACAVGRHPFAARDYFSLEKSICEDPLPALPERYTAGTMGRQFVDFISKALDRDETTRPTATHLLQHAFPSNVSGEDRVDITSSSSSSSLLLSSSSSASGAADKLKRNEVRKNLGFEKTGANRRKAHRDSPLAIFGGADSSNHKRHAALAEWLTHSVRLSSRGLHSSSDGGKVGLRHVVSMAEWLEGCAYLGVVPNNAELKLNVMEGVSTSKADYSEKWFEDIRKVVSRAAARAVLKYHVRRIRLALTTDIEENSALSSSVTPRSQCYGNIRLAGFLRLRDKSSRRWERVWVELRTSNISYYRICESHEGTVVKNILGTLLLGANASVHLETRRSVSSLSAVAKALSNTRLFRSRSREKKTTSDREISASDIIDDSSLTPSPRARRHLLRRGPIKFSTEGIRTPDIPTIHYEDDLVSTNGSTGPSRRPSRSSPKSVGGARSVPTTPSSVTADPELSILREFNSDAGNLNLVTARNYDGVRDELCKFVLRGEKSAATSLHFRAESASVAKRWVDAISYLTEDDSTKSGSASKYDVTTEVFFPDFTKIHVMGVADQLRLPIASVQKIFDHEIELAMRDFEASTTVATKQKDDSPDVKVDASESKIEILRDDGLRTRGRSLGVWKWRLFILYTDRISYGDSKQPKVPKRELLLSQIGDVRLVAGRTDRFEVLGRVMGGSSNVDTPERIMWTVRAKSEGHCRKWMVAIRKQCLRRRMSDKRSKKLKPQTPERVVESVKHVVRHIRSTFSETSVSYMLVKQALIKEHGIFAVNRAKASIKSELARVLALGE